MQLARAQAIQVYDRICDFEGVKGSSEIQQKMTLGMSQIPTEMSMVFSTGALVVLLFFLCFCCLIAVILFSGTMFCSVIIALISLCISLSCDIPYITVLYTVFSSHWLFSLGL